jgi:hypothetical protein
MNYGVGWSPRGGFYAISDPTGSEASEQARA